MNKNQALVSVIMSTYNSEKTIKGSIESILNQTYQNLEFLIVDDFSEDNTVNEIDRYINKNKNIKLFKNKENIGLTKSLNFLLGKSNGKYIARQDDDDISDLKRIEKQVELIERYDLDFSSSRAKIINTNKKIPGVSYYFPFNIIIKYKNPFIHGALLIKKEVLDEIGGYDNDFYYSQDYKLMTKLLNEGYQYKFTDEVLYTLNMNDNISNNKKAEQQYYANCVRRNTKPNLII